MKLTRSAFLLLAVVVYSVGCGTPSTEPDYVARVGETYLLTADLEDALSALPPGRDSTEAKRQFVEQWVVNTLLEQEARQSGLLQDAGVRRLLVENERSVLVSAYVERIYEENPVNPSPSDIEQFFEVNKERLRLREPFLRVRYLYNSDRDSTFEARRLLQRAMRGAGVDSLWAVIARTYSHDVEGSLGLSGNYFAESRLLSAYPRVKDVLRRLADRQVSAVIEDGGRFHLVQVVDRVPAGTIPKIPWINEEISRQLVMERRKQTVARTVQNLRTMAAARNALDIRLPDVSAE